ncbi:MAG TPA: 1-acyl-sn-glycerol-3-phosphate acyltransferase, partial [Anaerolineales bacterium]|nr:1-acyl-sn-glycerol-3-phosphate acyltransferase [Anaerolineales bacterium]
ADSDHTGKGLLEVDIRRITSQMTLVSRRDGYDDTRRRSSSWFLFQKNTPSSQRGVPEQTMNTHSDNFHALRETLIYDLTKALALPQTDLAKSFVRLIFGRAVNAAAELATELDCAVAEGGLIAGARQGLPRFVKSYEAQGIENIPPHGPLIIASNHPASVDSLVISAFINRRDYKLIIGDIPFFEHLPHLSQCAIYAPEEKNVMGRMQVIRESIRHLRQGGALLIFPLGGIEADPEFMPEPDGEFHSWSRSLKVFMQRVPDLQILVTIASGVISPAAMRHPITWVRKARADRQRLAFIYQLARQVLSGRQIFDLRPRVTFGEILSGTNPERVLAEVEWAARRTLERHMAWAHV